MWLVHVVVLCVRAIVSYNGTYKLRTTWDHTEVSVIYREVSFILRVFESSTLLVL